MGFERWECDDVLGTSRGAFGSNNVLEGGYGKTNGAEHDDRSVLAEAVVAGREPGGGETQVEGTMLGDQRHRGHLTQQVGVRIERHTVGISLDPKPGTEFLEGIDEVGQVRIEGRWADVDINRRVPGVM